MIILQVVDRLIVGTRAFLKIEDREFKLLLSKPRLPLQPTVTCFIGVELSVKTCELIAMTEKEKIIKLAVPRTEEGLRSQRAQAYYISVKFGLLSV